MPRSFLILLRMHTRIDHILIRQRDTRIFHSFGSHHVIRISTFREMPWDKIRGFDPRDEEACARGLMEASECEFPTDRDVVMRDLVRVA